MNEAAKQAAWERCRAWQAKALEQKPLESRPNQDQDHEFKKIISHDHERVKPTQKDGAALFKVVNTDPDFQLAVSWGAWPQALFNAAKLYGIPKVKKAVGIVKNYTGVKNKSAYLMTVIKSL